MSNLMSGLTHCGTMTPAFDPATLSLTGWWRANYGGSPWASSASAGAGGNLTEATNPPSTGAAVNGYTPADFDATNDLLSAGSNNNVYLSATASSGWVLFYVDNSFAAGANRYDEGTFLTDATNAETVVGHTNSGFFVCYYDGGFRVVDVAAATGGWHLGQWRHDNTNLYVRVDSSGWSSTACGTLSFLTPSAFQVGRTYGAAHWLDGKILEIGISNTDLGEPSLDDVKSYINARYALAL